MYKYTLLSTGHRTHSIITKELMPFDDLIQLIKDEELYTSDISYIDSDAHFIKLSDSSYIRVELSETTSYFVVAEAKLVIYSNTYCIISH